MAILEGYGGSVKLGVNVVAELDNWSIDIKRKLGDSSAFGDEWDERGVLTGGWSGKASGRLDESDATGQALLKAHIMTAGGGAALAMKFHVVTASKHYDGNAFISSMAVNTVRDGFIEVDFTFDGSGALSYHATI